MGVGDSAGLRYKRDTLSLFCGLLCMLQCSLGCHRNNRSRFSSCILPQNISVLNLRIISFLYCLWSLLTVIWWYTVIYWRWWWCLSCWHCRMRVYLLWIWCVQQSSDLGWVMFLLVLVFHRSSFSASIFLVVGCLSYSLAISSDHLNAMATILIGSI